MPDPDDPCRGDGKRRGAPRSGVPGAPPPDHYIPEGCSRDNGSDVFEVAKGLSGSRRLAPSRMAQFVATAHGSQLTYEPTHDAQLVPRRDETHEPGERFLLNGGGGLVLAAGKVTTRRGARHRRRARRFSRSMTASGLSDG